MLDNNTLIQHNMFNEYGFNEGTYLWDATHKLRHEINQLREDVVKTIEVQTETQTKDAEQMRTNQTSLFGKLMDTIKSVFTGSNESGEEESFYKMIARENNETQEYLASQQKTTSEKLGGIINSLNSISTDIESNTSGDSTNAKLIKDAISNLKLIVN